MKEPDWDRRYREGFYRDVLNPHELLLKYWQKIPKGIVIDIAMGYGRDGNFLSSKGYKVIGIEKSIEALRIFKETFKASNKNITCLLGDANHLPFKENTAEGIIVFYFLLRNIMEKLKDILKKDGIIIYETYLKRQNDMDRWRNPEYLLEDGELYSYFNDFEILLYEELILEDKQKKKAIARFVGRKR
ncbi:MAG: class I SAM-dependent methyltransferase [Syntrophorhabdaceae bacterium]|nr:class I SAM-dependent methyltransferase [Syntrophorhabdaceae bacterium]